ncbi:unnamed protein product, partial [Brassica rapa subsp. trilocularis]
MSPCIKFKQWRENSLIPFHKSMVETTFLILHLATYLVFTETIHRLVIVNLSCAGDNPQQEQRSRHWAQAV